jgi:hypothetical protein
MRRFEVIGPVATEIAITEVIGKYQYYIRYTLFIRR